MGPSPTSQAWIFHSPGLAQGHNAVKPMRVEPKTPPSVDKLSTTEQMHSHFVKSLLAAVSSEFFLNNEQ